MKINNIDGGNIAAASPLITSIFLSLQHHDPDVSVTPNIDRLNVCVLSHGVLVLFWSCSSQHQDLAATGGSRPGDEVRRCEKGADQGQRQGQRQGGLSWTLAGLTFLLSICRSIDCGDYHVLPLRFHLGSTEIKELNIFVCPPRWQFAQPDNLQGIKMFECSCEMGILISIMRELQEKKMAKSLTV